MAIQPVPAVPIECIIIWFHICNPPSLPQTYTLFPEQRRAAQEATADQRAAQEAAGMRPRGKEKYVRVPEAQHYHPEPDQYMHLQGGARGAKHRIEYYPMTAVNPPVETHQYATSSPRPAQLRQVVRAIGSPLVPRRHEASPGRARQRSGQSSVGYATTRTIKQDPGYRASPVQQDPGYRVSPAEYRCSPDTLQHRAPSRQQDSPAVMLPDHMNRLESNRAYTPHRVQQPYVEEAYEATDRDVRYDSAPGDVRYDSAPGDVRYDSAPGDVRYGPGDVRFASTESADQYPDEQFESVDHFGGLYESERNRCNSHPATGVPSSPTPKYSVSLLELGSTPESHNASSFTSSHF